MPNNSTLRAPIAISLGAIAGALCRYYAAQWLRQSINIELPNGTLGINVIMPREQRQG